MDADCFSSSSEGEGGGLHARIQEFLSPLALPTGGGSADQRPRVGRVAVQSLGVPHASGAEPGSEWELLALLHATRGALRGKAAAALVTLPPALHSAAFAARAKHMADAVLSVECLTEDDEVMASMVTDFRDAMGLLRVHKLPSLSTQVSPALETTAFAMKLVRRRRVALERLHPPPVSAGAGDDGGAAGLLCAGPANQASPLDF